MGGIVWIDGKRQGVLEAFLKQCEWRVASGKDPRTFGWGAYLELWVPLKKQVTWDFPAGPVVKNLPCNPGDSGSTPCLGAEFPHAREELSPQATSRESMCRLTQ